MNAEHTPGPWSITDTKSKRDPAEFTYSIGIKGCRLASVPRYSDEDMANARLIASAPELLEALKYVVQYHRDHDSGEGELFGLDFVTTCIAAISKVED